MKKDQMHDIIRQSVLETLTSLGIDINNPLDVQKDLQYIRRMREGSDAVKGNVIKAIIATTIPTCIYVVWLAIKRSILGDS